MATLQAHLETIRSKPEHIRRRIAFWSAFGVTAIIFVFWLGAMTSFGGSQPVVAAAVDRAGTPSQSLVAGIGAFFGDIGDLIFGTKKVTYTNSVQVSPGK